MQFFNLALFAGAASAVALPAASSAPSIPECSYNAHKFIARKQPHAPHVEIKFNLSYVCDADPDIPKGNCSVISNHENFYNAHGSCDGHIKKDDFRFNFLEKENGDWLLAIEQNYGSPGEATLPNSDFHYYKQNGKEYVTYMGPTSVYCTGGS